MTPKQEKYCLKFVECSNKTEAYRHAYDCDNMKDETINRKAFDVHKVGKISARIKELQEKLEDKAIYTIEQSIKRDLKLIKMYEDALIVLSDKDSKEKDIEVSGRTIRFIGATGYSQAQDRISKQRGFFEQHNKQKNDNKKTLTVEIVDRK